MSDMQSMVDRMRGSEHQPSQEEMDMAEHLIDTLLAAVESGKITAEEAKDIIRKAPNTMEEMSATGGGVGSGGATFTPGSGMQYAQALDKPKKKMKESYSKKDYRTPDPSNIKKGEPGKFKPGSSFAFKDQPTAETRDGKEVKVGSSVYHAGEKAVITKIFKDNGKNRISAKKEDGTIVTGSPMQYTSVAPSAKESKDKEPKLAAGKLKKNYAVDKFGFTPAPSIPNRPSTGGFQYKALWDESEELQESYSRFKKATRERDAAGQYHTGVGLVRKKLAEVNRMVEYLATLKSDLTTAGMVNETTHTKRSLEKMTEMIKSIYVKHKKLK